MKNLRDRAERHHRGPQAELVATIEVAADEQAFGTPADILVGVGRLG